MDEINASLATYGYIALFFYSLGGGYIAIVAAGIFAYLGNMNILVVILVASIGNFIGDTLLFYLARNDKATMQGYLKKHRRKLALAHILIKKYGDAVVVFQKYIYGVKTLVPLAIGLTKYNFKRFNIINAFSSLLWGVSVGLGSYYMGSVLVPIVDYLGNHFYLVILALVSIVALTWWYFTAATKKRVNRTD